MITHVRNSLTGRFVAKVWAKLNPAGTETESVKDHFTKNDLRLIRDALDEFTITTPTHEKTIIKLMPKINRMLK